MNKQAKWFAAIAAAVMVTGAQAALESRAGGTMVYDTVLDVTWISDMSYARTSGYDADGAMTWNDAMSWAAGLEYGGYSDWRLPDPLDADGRYSQDSGELAHLFFGDFGYCQGYTYPACDRQGPNPIGISQQQALDNFALFSNVSGISWTNWPVPPDGYMGIYQAIVFTTPQGGNEYEFGWVQTGAVAVRDGDIAAPIPEPSTYALMLVGLAAVAFAAKRRRAVDQVAA